MTIAAVLYGVASAATHPSRAVASDFDPPADSREEPHEQPPPNAREAERILVTVDGQPVTLAMYQQFLWFTEGTRRLDELINRVLLEKEAERLHVSLSYDEVDQAVEQRLAELTRIFQGDRGVLERNLGERYGNLEDYRASLRAQLFWASVLDRCIQKSRVADEATLRQGFESRYGPQGVQVRLRHIFLGKAEEDPTGNRAQELKKRIENGDDFAAVAALYSQDTESAEGGGEMTVLGARRFGEDFQKAVAALPPQAPPQVIPSPRGWHIVENLGETRTDFDRVRESLVEELETTSPTPSERRHFLKKLRARASIER